MAGGSARSTGSVYSGRAPADRGRGTMEATNGDPVDAAAQKLDQLAVEAREGKVGLTELVRAFLGATVAMPTSTDPTGNPLAPVCSTIDGVEHVVVATGEEALGRTAHLAPYAISMSGRDVVRGLDPAYAVLVNTTVGGFSIPLEALAQIREQLPR